MEVWAPRAGRFPAASADTLARSGSKAAARSRRGVATYTVVLVSVRVRQALVWPLNQCRVSRSLVLAPLPRERVFLSVDRRWHSILLHYGWLWLFWEGQLLHAYLLKGVCDFTFKSLALWEFLCLFVVFFSSFFSLSKCLLWMRGQDRGALRDRARVRTEAVRGLVMVSMIWLMGVGIHCPVNRALLRFSVSWLFIFLQLPSFINLSPICGIRGFSSFPWSLLSFFISSSYDMTLVCDNFLAPLLDFILASDNLCTLYS